MTDNCQGDITVRPCIRNVTLTWVYIPLSAIKDIKGLVWNLGLWFDVPG
jgi:hypothetical protein